MSIIVNLPCYIRRRCTRDLHRPESKWVALELFTDTVRQEGLDIRLLFLDVEGFYKTIDCHVYIPSKAITAAAGQLTKINVEFLVSGGLTISTLSNDIIMITEDDEDLITEWSDYINIE